MRNDIPAKNPDPARGSFKNGATTKNDFAGNRTPSEFRSDPDNYANTHGAAKAVMIALAASLVAVLIFGGALGGAGADIAVQISSTYVTYDSISYTIIVPAGAEGVVVAVYNSLSRQERALAEGENSGVFQGLGADRTYTLEVYKKEGLGESVLASKKLHTMKTE